MKTIVEKVTTDRKLFTKDEIDLLTKATEDVCMYCPRPPAWDGGEEECERCMVSKLCHLLWEDWHAMEKAR